MISYDEIDLHEKMALRAIASTWSSRPLARKLYRIFLVAKGGHPPVRIPNTGEVDGPMLDILTHIMPLARKYGMEDKDIQAGAYASRHFAGMSTVESLVRICAMYIGTHTSHMVRIHSGAAHTHRNHYGDSKVAVFNRLDQLPEKQVEKYVVGGSMDLCWVVDELIRMHPWDHTKWVDPEEIDKALTTFKYS